jgi:hypothetical protein
MLTVECKDDEGDASDDQGCDDVGALPGVGASSPGEADEEDDEAAYEEDDSNKVHFLELLPLGLAPDVELTEGWGIVPYEIQNKTAGGDDDSNVV